MILYSIVPPEIVFAGFGATDDIRYIEGKYRGERVLVAQMPDGNCKMSRLLSTRPSTFLDPAFEPGITVDERELI